MFGGWPKIGTWTDAGSFRAGNTSTPFINFAQRGKVAGAINVKVLHILYRPWKDMNAAQAVPASVAFVDAAKREGYDGVALDWERNPVWANVDVWRAMHNASKRNGLPFIHVPKFGLDHYVDTRGGTPEAAVRLVEKYSDGCFVWKYDQTWQGYLGNGVGGEGWWRKNGYTKPMCFIVDAMSRYTPARPVIDGLRSRGKSVVLFAPERGRDVWGYLTNRN